MIAWWGSLEARHHPTNCRKSASVNKRIEDDKGGWARPTLFPTTLNPERTHSSQRQNEPIRRNDRTNPFVGTTERTHSSERQNEPIRGPDSLGSNLTKIWKSKPKRDCPSTASTCFDRKSEAYDSISENDHRPNRSRDSNTTRDRRFSINSDGL
jgi:hypothetical protein